MEPLLLRLPLLAGFLSKHKSLHENPRYRLAPVVEELLVQVAYAIDDIETEKREMKALLKSKNELPCKKAIIITYDTEKQIDEKGIVIDVVPVWKWLLE